MDGETEMKSLFVAGVAAMALALNVGVASAQTSTAQPNQYSPVNGSAQTTNGQPNQYSPVNGSAQLNNGQPNQYSPVNGSAKKTDPDSQKKNQ
jgi:hypothetical protein